MILWKEIKHLLNPNLGSVFKANKKASNLHTEKPLRYSSIFKLMKMQ